VKISFNRPKAASAYGGGAHFVTNFSNYLEKAGHSVCHKLEPGIDLIFMIDPRPNEGGYSIQEIFNYKQQFPKTKMLHRVNECDKRKNTNFMDKTIMLSNQLADHTIFISKWLSDYFIQKGFNNSYAVILNGCNTSHFYPTERLFNPARPKIVTHHWSDNWMKGFDIYTKIDEYLQENDRFDFTYVGRYFQGYSPKKTSIISPLYGHDLGSELRNHDIYVTASRWEPCGMHHIEGASCGLPVLYHVDGGGINETCANHGYQFRSFAEFLKYLDLVTSKLGDLKNKINYEQLSSKTCSDNYYKEIVRMFSEK
jgi:hypothetical protein